MRANTYIVFTYMYGIIIVWNILFVGVAVLY